MHDPEPVTCTIVLNTLFVRRGDTAISLARDEAIALKRHLKPGMVLRDDQHTITLSAADVTALQDAITTLQRDKQRDRRRTRRAIWN